MLHCFIYFVSFSMLLMNCVKAFYKRYFTLICRKYFQNIPLSGRKSPVILLQYLITRGNLICNSVFSSKWGDNWCEAIM